MKRKQKIKSSTSILEKLPLIKKPKKLLTSHSKPNQEILKPSVSHRKNKFSRKGTKKKINLMTRPCYTKSLNSFSKSKPRKFKKKSTKVTQSSIQIGAAGLLLPNQVLKRQYKIIRKLGKGASTTVYLCRDLFTKNLLAIKVFSLEALSSSSQFSNLEVSL